jgi:hypothetical protein
VFQLDDINTPYLVTCPKAKKEVVSKAIMWNGRKPDNWFWEGVKLVTITKKPPQKYWRDTSKIVDYPLSLCLERGLDCQ